MINIRELSAGSNRLMPVLVFNVSVNVEPNEHVFVLIFVLYIYEFV